MRSALHHIVESMDQERIAEAFENRMKIFTDDNDENFFTLAIKSMNIKKILGTMKYLSQISEEEFAEIAESIPLNYILR